MRLDLPSPDIGATESLLADYEPERYYAIWQFPEERYAYMIDPDRTAHLIVLDEERLGTAYLRADALMNRRPPSLYRLDALTLPEAFAAARAQPTPFVASFGASVEKVKGVEILTQGFLGIKRLRRIPL